MLVLFFLMMVDKVELTWNVKTNDGLVSLFETVENVYLKSGVFGPQHIFFQSFDEELAGNEIVLTLRVDRDGEHLLYDALDYRRVTIWAKDRIESYNDGQLMAHKADVITELVAEDRYRPKAVVFTVPLAFAAQVVDRK